MAGNTAPPIITLAVSLNLINGITGQFSLGHAGFMVIGAYTAGSIMKHVAPTSAALWPTYLGVLLLGAGYYGGRGDCRGRQQ